MSEYVYLLWTEEYERELDGVFASLEAAQSEHVHDDWAGDETEGRWRCTWNVPGVPGVPPTLETITLPVVNGVAHLPDGRTIETPSKYVSIPRAVGGSPGTPAESCYAVIERRPWGGAA